MKRILLVFSFLILSGCQSCRHTWGDYGSDKNYKIPKGFKLVTDGNSYGIKDLSDGEMLHHNERYNSLEFMYTTIDRPLTYSDSSKAKGALRYYLEVERRDRAPGFK